MIIIPANQIIGKLPKVEKWSAVKPAPRSPIDTSGIKDFKGWLNVNGFDSRYHPGFDFMAFQRTSGELVIGLPLGTPIVSIFEGVIINIVDPGCSYLAEIRLAHAICEENLLCSVIKHAKPIPGLKPFDLIPAGGTLGHLADEDTSYLDGRYHLHLELLESTFTAGNNVIEIDPHLDRRIDPQPVLFPEETLPYAQIIYPNIHLTEKPAPPVWLTPIEFADRIRRFW
ncbi:MAG: hypothetical protein PHG97_03475 [Candidatus Margulisbacteria bacterium]|nr:hypothetical protein [Candidatus Margulisiibacteriota bacterium]